MIEYSIVMPAYNEEAVIASSLTQVISFMKSYSSSYEVIIVDDGSEDKTVGVVENFAKDHPEIVLKKNPHKGKGFSVRTGILMSSGKYVLMADSDMATPIDEIKRLMVWVKDHDFDIVIGSREGVGAVRKNEPYIRHLMGRVFNALVQLLTVRGINDTQCGFKLFKAEVAHDIFNRLVLFGPDTPETNVPRVTAFDVEVLVVAKRQGYTIKEVPVHWTYVQSSRVHPLRDTIANVTDVLAVKTNDLFGKYSKEEK
jgi:glycosyltransferase involved in cell wall biosynthesis